MPSPRVYTQRNGLRVVLVPDDRSPAAAFYLWVKVGSADERPRESGLAHVLEHMLFKGTPRRGVGEIAQEIEGCGGDINAYTSFDATVYHAVVASRFFDTGLDVVIDAVTRSTIDANELALEKEVILEEIKRDEDQPSRRVSHALFEAAYRRHPYGRPVIGTRELVAGYDRPTVRAFYERWYVPRNMLLVVAGSFDPREAKAKIARATSDFRGGRPPAHRRAAEPAQRGVRAVTQSGDVHESWVESAFHIPGVRHRDVPTLDTLAIAVGQGDKSRLAWRVRRDARAVTAISAFAFTPVDPGLFFVSASVPPEKTENGFREAIRETFQVLREPISAEELERAKVSIEGDAVYERETAQGLARKIGFYEALGGGIEAEARYMDAVRKLAPADLQRAAERYLHPSRFTASVLAPEGAVPAPARLQAIVGEEWRSLERARSRAAAARKGGGRSAASRGKGTAKRRAARHAAPSERRIALPGGATLLVRPDRAVPLLALRAVFLGGLRFENDATAGNTHLVARVLCKSTHNRSFAEIVRAVDRFAGGISGFSGFNSFGVRLDALSAHTRDALELFGDVLRNPGFEDREVDQEREQVLESLRSLEDHPSAWVMRLFTRALFTRHPYRLSMIGEASRVAGVSGDELRAFYERISVPENLSVAVVGDVDPEEIEDLVSRALDGFGRGRSFTMPDVPPEPAVDAPREVAAVKDREQAHMVLGFLGASFGDADRHALELIATALSGQGGRLFLELRDRQALAYSVTAFSQEALDPGYFCVYIATDPKKRERALDAIRRELDRLRRDGLSAEELERNQRQIVGSFEIDLQRAASRAANLAFNDRYGLGFLDYREYPRRILAVTREQIVEAAQRFLDPGRSVLATVGPDADAATAIVAG